MSHPTDTEISLAILKLLALRGPDKSICPSEVARQLDPSGQWRSLMEPVRRVARDLARKGKLEFMQGGEAVDADNHKGPVRLRSSRIIGKDE